MADDGEHSETLELGRDEQPPGPPPAMVGVGVCFASLGSLTALFASLKPDAHAAYFIVARQKGGLDVATVTEALEQASAWPVRPAANGERIAARHVYVAGTDDLITIQDGQLRVRSSPEPVGHRGAFDSLLISLAEEAHERAVAVILAGLGSDGAAGVVATKKFGGLSIAEIEAQGDPAAQGSSDPAGVADMTLPADRIADEIARYIANLQPILQEERDEKGDEREAHVAQIATVLRNATGHDFHGYKRGTFIRRIQRRMQVMQVEGGMEAYVARLRADREEVQHLFQDLLIGVTQFFRDPGEFDSLERELPRLFEGKGVDDQFRVWVLGCATGEEAYSIAILLREHMATLDHPPDVQIFATDLDARALSLARAGRYAETIANHIRPDRLERWFAREGDTYCVSKELREMCIFSPHNIVKDAPFSRIDILSCRNLLIYLSADLQNRVIPIFHFSLRPGGILFLGSSENVTRHQKLFAPIDRKSRVFRRQETATRIIPDFPLTARVRGETAAPLLPPAPFDARLPASTSRQADAVAERYAPAYVVVDAHGDVLHFSGRTGRYLEPSTGAASLNLLNLVHRDLRLEVRSALQNAVADGRRVELPRLTIRQGDLSLGVNVIVEPLSSGGISALVVIFQDLGPMAESAADVARPTTDDHVQRLEAELRVTRDRLQAPIEELESTNEELKSSNEEYQSINEELQSANEEMETSKEELQSVNEELQTVNGELAHRVQELGRTNSDLKNLLESTQIATVFLDNDLRIRNFTPAATDIFHLLETDVGRPLDHVVSRVSYPELQDDVRRVLKTLVPIDRQVFDEAADRHYAGRVLPYRSVDNYISGAVVTFTDLTAVRDAEAALQRSEENYRALFGSIDEAFCVVEMMFDAGDRPVDYRFLQVNPAFERQTGLADPVGRTALELVPGLDRRWFDTYGRVARTGEPARFEDEAAAMGRWYDVYAFRAGTPKESKVAILFRDIGERRQMEQARRESEERLQAFVTASSDATYRMSADWRKMFFLDGRGFMPQTDGPTLRWIKTYILAEDRPAVQAAIDQAIAAKTMFVLEHRVRTADGGIGWTFSRAVPIFDTAGGIVEWFGTATDVTELHEATRALREAERRQQVLIGGVPQLVWRAVRSGDWTWVSPQWSEFTGQAEPDSHGSGWLEALHPEDREVTRAAWSEAEAEGGFDIEHRIRNAADDEYGWFRTRATAVRDEAGLILEWLGTSTDVDEMRALHKRQEVLVAELQHRVRNMLTVVRSVFAQTVDSGGNLEDVADHFKGRLDALARTQAMVTRSAEGTVDLQDLVRDELLSVGVGDGPKLRITGPDVTLKSKAAESIGLAIHELTTNALKYGALKVPSATLAIEWVIDMDQGTGRRLDLVWTEQGVPAVSTKPSREGFGRELIEEALPYRLGAETKLEFLGGGVRCFISVPLPGDDEAQGEPED